MAGAIVFLGFVLVAGAAQDAPAKPEAPQAPTPVPFGIDEVEPFVPLHPRTADDRKELEALRAYVAARALEDRRRPREALTLLEKALPEAPDSVAILRRLSALNFMLGRHDEALKYARRVLDVDPGDTATLTRLLDYYTRRGDAAGAEALLRSNEPFRSQPFSHHPSHRRSGPAEPCRQYLVVQQGRQKPVPIRRQMKPVIGITLRQQPRFGLSRRGEYIHHVQVLGCSIVADQAIQDLAARDMLAKPTPSFAGAEIAVET